MFIFKSLLSGNSISWFNILKNFCNSNKIFLFSGTQTPSTNSLFKDSCVLVNKELKHRVIISKTEFDTFNLFSCYLKDKNFCDYEVNKWFLH